MPSLRSPICGVGLLRSASGPFLGPRVLIPTVDFLNLAISGPSIQRKPSTNRRSARVKFIKVLQGGVRVSPANPAGNGGAADGAIKKSYSGRRGKGESVLAVSWGSRDQRTAGDNHNFYLREHWYTPSERARDKSPLTAGQLRDSTRSRPYVMRRFICSRGTHIERQDGAKIFRADRLYRKATAFTHPS
ncbi:unnamed protein product, partial [Iphiclides podalirius]